MMTDERYKAIMAELGQPQSHSLLAALRQVANEVAQEVQAAERERCAKIVDVPPEAQAWEIHGGQETMDVLRDVAAHIRRA